MKFTIRDLFLITAFVAVSLGWWLDRSRLPARDAAWEQSFQLALERLSFLVRKKNSRLILPVDLGEFTAHMLSICRMMASSFSQSSVSQWGFGRNQTFWSKP
jgi:hypothetical protein